MQQVKAQNISSGYEVGQSLLLESGDSSYLHRTPAAAGDRTTWTFSVWLKRSQLGGFRNILSARGSSGELYCGFRDEYGAEDILNIGDYGGNYNFLLLTKAEYRDPASWMHFVLCADTNNATSSERIRLYINGERITDWLGSGAGDPIWPTQGYQTFVISTEWHTIGAKANPNAYYDGYMSEVNFIDGQALEPEHFALEDSNGAYNPIPYTGTYGTNGFYLPFEASNIGADASGNGNNFTPTGLSTESVVIDTPTNNYCTLNPLDDALRGATTYAGNLGMSGTQTWGRGVRATFPPNALDKYAFSVKWTRDGATGSKGGTFNYVGLVDADSQYLAINSSNSGAANYMTLQQEGVMLTDSGYVMTLGTSSAGAITIQAGEVTEFRVDGNEVSIIHNGLWVTDFTLTSGYRYTPAVMNDRLGYYGDPIFDFGQRGYTSPDSTYKTLCTKNLPDPLVKPKENFEAVTYTGNGGTQSITGVGFQPDLVWIKSRSFEANNCLTDAVRGATKTLFSDGTWEESTLTEGVGSFDSDGFTVGNNTSMNGNLNSFVAWNFRGGDTVTNNDGSIPSQVSANRDMGFSVVSWDGNSVNGASIGHGLGKIPDLIIYKNRNDPSGYSWYVNSPELSGNGYVLTLDTNGAEAAPGGWVGFDWNASTITFPSTDYIGAFNLSGSSYIAYCFANTEMLQVGAYTGNGLSDGSWISLPFKPAYVMVKPIDLPYNWTIIDKARNPYNTCDLMLQADLPDAESETDTLDLYSNGFKAVNDAGYINGSGNLYLYLSIAEQHFKYARGR